MFERFIQNDISPNYLSGKGKKKEAKKERVLPKAGSYTVKDIEEVKKKMPTYQEGLQ